MKDDPTDRAEKITTPSKGFLIAVLVIFFVALAVVPAIYWWIESSSNREKIILCEINSASYCSALCRDVAERGKPADVVDYQRAMDRLDRARIQAANYGVTAEVIRVEEKQGAEQFKVDFNGKYPRGEKTTPFKLPEKAPISRYSGLETP